MPLRPSTPIREVIGNYYGELAEGEMMSKYDEMRYTRDRFISTAKAGMRTTKHTQKSKVAAHHVATRGKQYEKKAQLMKGSQDLFKMKKFKNVEGRTNTNLKPFKQTIEV